MSDQHLVHRFGRLKSALERLLTLLSQETRHAWVFDLERHEHFDAEARSELITVLERLEYQDERDGRETDICPGILGASGKLIKLVAELNRQRDLFKQAVLASNRDDKQAARRIMSRNGYPRLHFKQLYRHLPILLKPPRSIRFTWGATRSIRKITHQQAYQRLVRLAGKDPTPGYQQQLALLQEHPRNEPIAIVQDLKPHIKANVCWVEGCGRDKVVSRKLISAPLPILIPLDPGEALPEYSAAFPDERKARKARSDVKIESQAFLPSIRGHRYQR